MTTSSDDDDVGYSRPPREFRWKKGQSGNPRKKPRRPETAVEMVDRFLLSLVNATMDGETKRVTALEAIISQLQIKELSGNFRASRILLEYREFASQAGEKEVRLVFIDDEDQGPNGDQA